MEKLSVWEFAKYYEKRNYSIFCLSSQDQKWDRVDCPLKLHLQFEQIRVWNNPNRIYLHNGGSMICFEQVKYVFGDSEMIPIGDVLHVVCGIWNNSKTDTIYSVIAVE